MDPKKRTTILPRGPSSQITIISSSTGKKSVTQTYQIINTAGLAGPHLLERRGEGDPPALERRTHDRERGVSPPPAHAGADHHVPPQRPPLGAGVDPPHDLREQLRQEARPPLLVDLLHLLPGRRIHLRRDLRLPADGAAERGAGGRRQPGRAAPPGDHAGRPGRRSPHPRSLASRRDCGTGRRLARAEAGNKGGRTRRRSSEGKGSERKNREGTKKKLLMRKRRRKLKRCGFSPSCTRAPLARLK